MKLAFRMVTCGIILAGLLVIWGCGSESKQSPPQASEKAKPVIDKDKGKAKVVEISPGKEPVTGSTVKEEAKSTKTPIKILLDEEVFPPTSPGEKGITRQELERMKTLEPQTDPLDVEVFPPAAPGEKGLTLRDIENAKKQQSEIDPLDQEVFPPTNPGEKGVTLRELERLKALEPQTPQSPIEPLPVPKPRTRGER